MNTLTYKAQLDEALLSSESRNPDSIEEESSPGRNANGEFCKATTLILVVLFVCGILAFGISVVVWHFWDAEPDVLIPVTSTSETIGIVVVLLLCGILALGLPAAVWRYYERLDGESIPSIPLSEIPISDPIINEIINSAPPVHQKRIIGYYNEHESKDIPKSQLSKLTHAIFACVQMSAGGKVQFKDSKFEQRFLSLKQKSRHVESDLKVMISVGENSEHLSTVMGSWRRKRKFLNSILSFIKDHQIDGVNIFWEQPGESNKFKYSKFIKNLRRKLDELEKKDGKHLVVSIVVPRAGIEDWESGFDLDGILEHVDFINVLSMDYYSPLPNQPAGPSAPLYSGVGPRRNFNVDYTMRYYIGETRQPGKFNIVIPFYARLWRNVKERLKPDSEVFRNVEMMDGKVEGDAYMSRWTVDHEGFKLTPASWDEETKTSYICDHAARTFLTFETEKSLAEKIRYVNSMNLGGVWIWSIHTDDENGTLLNSLISSNYVSKNKSNVSRSSVLELV